MNLSSKKMGGKREGSGRKRIDASLKLIHRKEYARRYYSKNKGIIIKRGKEYYIKNKDKISIKVKGNIKKYNIKYRKALIDLLGGKCVKCGFFDARALQVDHINGGGSKERKETRRGNNFYMLKEILKNENQTKYQILCANCNWIKRYENNENRT